MTKESASPVIQNVAFAVNYFYQLQNSKVIQPMKLLISTIKSTAKAASLITYLSAISAKSITTEISAKFNNYRKDTKNPLG